MKELISLFCFSLSALFALTNFISCKSASVELKNYSPVVLVTASGNTNLTWYEKNPPVNDKRSSESGFLTGKINSTLNADNLEYSFARDTPDKSVEVFASVLAEKSFEILTAENSPDLPCYKAGNFATAFLENKISATGYKSVSSSNRSLRRATVKQSGAKSLVFLEFEFQKLKSKNQDGESCVKARVEMKVNLLNEEGKCIFKNKYTAVSSEGALLYGNTWSREEVISYFPALVEQCTSDFLSECYSQ